MLSLVLTIVSVVSASSAEYSIEDTLDLEDILRPDLMPSVVIEGPVRRTPNLTKELYLNTSGSWDEAFTTMKFHREMLNEYLCRNFVAGEIVSRMRQPMISKRIGRPFSIPETGNERKQKRKSRTDLSDIKQSLLSDPGSSNYRDWLTKTTLLEDIYRNHEKNGNDNSRTAGDPEVEYDGGEITGYAMPGPTGTQGVISNFPLQEQTSIIDAEKHAGDYDYTHIHFHGENKGSHGMALAEIFDVALTALAFLSFGIFILQVIMCISMNKTPMMMPVNGMPTVETVDDIRFRRDVSSPLREVNEMTRKVLKSIEVGLDAEKDRGACLRRVLCENNKFSRSLSSTERILVPVWGLGMSWLSGRLLRPGNGAVLDSLKACALGLADAECDSVYSGCDMKKLME